MWWGGRGQSFNIAPQKEEPEMGVRRGDLGLGGGDRWAGGCEWGGRGDARGRKRIWNRRVCLLSTPAGDGAWSVFYTVSSSGLIIH